MGHFKPFRQICVLLVLFISLAAQGQESLRLSLASADAARARREAATSLGYYNIKLGPTAWTFGTSLGIELNDNIRLEGYDQKSDIIFHPGLNTRMVLPLSDVNSFNLALGAGYSAYAEHSEFDRFYVTPGSELSFDIYIGDFWINLHDRFSMTEDNYQDPTVVGSADYTLLQNALGETTTWDLNKAVVRLGYDHVNYVTIQGAGPADTGHPDGQSEVFSSSAGYRLTSTILAGAEVGGGLFKYTQPTTNQFYSDATEWNVGSFVEAQISQYINGRASIGYTVYMPEVTGTSSSFDFRGLYAEIDLTHRLNQYVSYTLSGGRTVNFAFYGGTIDLYFARWQANWNLVRKFTLGTSFTYEHGTQLGFGGEVFDRYGPGISIGRAITKKLSASLAYQFYSRTSDQPFRDYNNNILTLNASYQF